MRMRVLTTKLRVEIENEMRVFLESLNFEIEMRVSQKSVYLAPSSLASAKGKKPTTLFFTASARASRARAKN